MTFHVRDRVRYSRYPKLAGVIEQIREADWPVTEPAWDFGSRLVEAVPADVPVCTFYVAGVRFELTTVLNDGRVVVTQCGHDWISVERLEPLVFDQSSPSQGEHSEGDGRVHCPALFAPSGAKERERELE